MKTFEEFWQWQVCVPTDMEDEARCIWSAATEAAKPRWNEICSCPEITEENNDKIVISSCGCYWIELPEIPE